MFTNRSNSRRDKPKAASGMTGGRKALHRTAERERKADKDPPTTGEDDPHGGSTRRKYAREW